MNISKSTNRNTKGKHVNSKLIALMAISIIATGCDNQSKVVRRISVTGSAINEANADRIEMHIQIDNSAKNNSDAVSINKKSVSELVSMLGNFKSSISNIRNSGAAFGERNEHDNKRKTYNAETEISFLITDPSIFDSLSIELSKIPGINVSRPKFVLSNEIELRAIVRDTAIQKAKEKAARMASALGMKLGKPIEITEGSLNYYSSSTSNSIEIPESSQGVSGKFSIKSEVGITFEMDELNF